jgi:DNA-binding transcriptional LysR family regulator
MYLSHPTVSERLAELEREVQMPLLERSRQGIMPTPQGTVLYERARKILNDLETLERTLVALRTEQDKQMRLAASSTLGEHLLPKWLKTFKRAMPESVPELFVGTSREVAELVGRRKAALGFIDSAWTNGSLIAEPLLDDELIIVVAPGHPWTRRWVATEDLPKEPFISRGKESGINEIIQRVSRHLGEVSLDVQMELSSTTAVKKVVEAGVGFSILSRITVSSELEAGTLVAVEGLTIPRKFVAIRHPAVTLNAAEKRFLEHLA